MNNRTKKKSSKIINKTFDNLIQKKDESQIEKLSSSIMNMISSKKLPLNKIPTNFFIHQRETIKFQESKVLKNPQIKTQENKKMKVKKTYNNNYLYTIPSKIIKKIPL